MGARADQVLAEVLENAFQNTQVTLFIDQQDFGFEFGGVGCRGCHGFVPSELSRANSCHLFTLPLGREPKAPLASSVILRERTSRTGRQRHDSIRTNDVPIPAPECGRTRGSYKDRTECELGDTHTAKHLRRMPKTSKHEAAASSGENPDARAASAAGRRVLVADDNAATCKQLRDLLAAEPGVPVDTVGDGREALAALPDRPYSFVITALKRPKLSGMDLIAELKKRPLPVAVIVTTGFGSIADAVQAMRLGATDFLTKPIDIDYLRL